MAANNPPLATLFHGSITIEQGCDPTLYGNGDISIFNTAYVGYGSPTQSTNTASGSIISYGGLGVSMNTNLGGVLTVNSTSNLQTTNINTTFGGVNISGGNGVNINVGGNVAILSTSGSASLSSSLGSLSLSSAGGVILSSNQNAASAIQIINNNAGGGTEIFSGQNSGVIIAAGSGGIIGTASQGNVLFSANGGNSTIQSSGGNVSILQYGGVPSQVLINSDGSGVNIQSANPLGNINISNNSTGSGVINNYSGSGGYFVTTNTGGPIGLSANGANSYFYVNATGGSGQSLTLGVTGGSYINNKLILQSNGTNNTSAILIQTTSTAGGILISQPVGSNGGVIVQTGTNGLNVNTQVGGGINLTANGAASSFINQTTSPGQNLTVCVQGTTGSSLILCSQGTGNNAIQLNATSNSGGILLNAAGPISINSTDTSTGINIGTNNLIPVNIGATNSTTTVYGNLDVRGTTTTVESTIVQIVNNIFQINSGPSGTADGGIAIKRWQPANDTSFGDVVNDTPDECGFVPGASANPITEIRLAVTSHTAVGYYNGWWIKIVSGTGSGQVRRIKSYSGSPNYLATIYSTADQTGVLNSPVPIQGLDLTTPVSATVVSPGPSQYCLYPCQWIMNIWDEQHKEMALVCSPYVNATSIPNIAHYVDLHINNLIANNIFATSINGTVADVQFDFTLNDNNNTPLELISANISPSTSPFGTYGVYICIVKPKIGSTIGCYSIFFIGSRGSSCGQSTRLISVKGSANQQLDMNWPTTNRPNIFYRPAPGTLSNTIFTMKVISI